MTMLAAYDRLIEDRKVENDPAQRAVLTELMALQSALAQKTKLFKKNKIIGLYIWGGVGRGKSMLMDLFFDSTAAPKKRRVHFHAFMQEVHDRIHAIRHAENGADPVITLARSIARETRLLCFDELQATDVADATLLYRLFSELFAQDVIVVSTSNRPPAELYTGGVQKERFTPFIALINERMRVLQIESTSDYRMRGTRAPTQVYFYPLGPDSDQKLSEMIAQLVPDPHPHTEHFMVKGRKVPLSFYDDITGRATFHDLCETALGAADYLALATRLRTLVLTGVPHLAAEKRNEAKRFVTLIDALYEHKVRLLITAQCPPEAIYADGDGSFEFARTVSRLKEMQSESWLKN